MAFVRYLLFHLMTCAATFGTAGGAWDDPDQGNPILPGYFADPTVLTYEGRHYLYATVEPWGGQTLGCWESSDFQHWTYRDLNWPTKAACTSPTSTDAMVWAPSVVRGSDGRFYLYVSVGSEIWVGVAEHPLGPWRNALGDRPLIAADFDRSYHMIDADLFIDDDGRRYLYWGSGWNWVNGACFAVEVAEDMVTFVGDVRQVTPENYFEGPTMLKHAGRYYLTYSNGKTISDTYEVRYAVSDHPLGPFREGRNSPILVTDHTKHIVSPGHHGFYRENGQVYIVYHRHRVPFEPGTAFRQVCLDELRFTAQGEIEPVVPTHRGPPLVRGRLRAGENLADPRTGARLTSSGSHDLHPIEHAFDNNYATRWVPSAGAPDAWLAIDLGATRRLGASELRFEYPTRTYRFAMEVSVDGRRWRTVVDARAEPRQGSPLVIPHEGEARYLRLLVDSPDAETPTSLLEWVVRGD